MNIDQDDIEEFSKLMIKENLQFKIKFAYALHYLCINLRRISFIN
jgi:hypothetical protein